MRYHGWSLSDQIPAVRVLALQVLLVCTHVILQCVFAVVFVIVFVFVFGVTLQRAAHRA